MELIVLQCSSVPKANLTMLTSKRFINTLDLNQYKDKITELLRQFKQRFQIFDQLETDFQVFFSPFTLHASDLFMDVQLGIIDLHCNSYLKTKFVLASLGTFYQYLFPGYQWRSQPKNWGRGKMFDFRRITLFCLEKRLSKYKMTAF